MMIAENILPYAVWVTCVLETTLHLTLARNINNKEHEIQLIKVKLIIWRVNKPSYLDQDFCDRSNPVGTG